MIKISDTRDYFIKDGKKFFYLADTLWSAFSNVSEQEWIEYLNRRKMQNFNVIQIDVLTQWDAGKPDMNIYPYRLKENGGFDFNEINEEYFIRARRMLQIAKEKGFTPALVVLWGNYVEGTWMSESDPKNIMPFENVEGYVRYIVKNFDEFEPIYIISGDTDFKSESERYYLKAFEVIGQLSPDRLKTMHPCGGAVYSDIYVNSDMLDFYIYQSSHDIKSQYNTYMLAQKFYNLPIKRPILNAEPCYEFSAHGGRYGRFGDFDVRKAVWQSLLSGAKAGVTYGCQGIWSWYRDGKEFANAGYGGKPMTWKDSLNLKGAYDVGFAKWIFETFDLFKLNPIDAILNKTQEIRMAMADDKSMFAIYAPYNDEIHVDFDMASYDVTLISMPEKVFVKPEIVCNDKESIIKITHFNTDLLIVGIKK